MKCAHALTEFGQLVCRDGTVHVMERCANCFVNVRGPAVWVPHDQVATVEGLPVFMDLRPARGQGSLFGGEIL